MLQPTDGIRKRKVSEIVNKSPAKKVPPEEGLILKPAESAKPVALLDADKSSESAAGSDGGILVTELSQTATNYGWWNTETPAKSRGWRWGLGGGLILILLAVILLSTVFARLTVVIKPRVDNLDIRDLDVTFDTSVSRTLMPQKVIPAELLEFSKEVSKEFTSSGREFVEEKARATVRIFNGFSSSPQKLVEGTRFLTEKGILFRLTKNIVVPGAKIENGKIMPQFAEAELAADKSGAESNFDGEVTLKIPAFKGTSKYESFYAYTSAGFTGGFKGETQTVSAADLKKAEEEVTKKVYAELEQEITGKVPSDFKFVKSLRDIQISGVDAPREHARVERFKVAARGRARVLVFREADVIELLQNSILPISFSGVGTTTSKEFVEGSASLNYQPASIDFVKGKAGVAVNGTLKVKTKISEVKLIELVKGKKEGSVIEALKSRQDLSSFRLKFFPPWLFKAPANPQKIKIQEE